MRVLFQGAGAIGIAGAALFTDSHDVAVVSRTGGDQPRNAYPRRVSDLDPTDSDSGSGSAGWTVNRVAATRRVTVTGWERAREATPWDLIVLSTRPGDLDPAVASAIREISPSFVAITSQVDGDLERAKREFPDAEAVIVGPAFLSERVEAGTVAAGREVRYWAPAGLPRFLIGGSRNGVRSLARGLGGLVQPVPLVAVLASPAVFIPFVAELSIRDDDWAVLKSHLKRPALAAAEAVRTRLGLRVPFSGHLARFVLKTMETIVPIDVTAYAGRHFARHRGQTRDMLTGWASSGHPTPTLKEQLAALDEQTAVRA